MELKVATIKTPVHTCIDLMLYLLDAEEKAFTLLPDGTFQSLEGKPDWYIPAGFYTFEAMKMLSEFNPSKVIEVSDGIFLVAE